MRIKNTSQYPSDEVRKLVRFALKASGVPSKCVPAVNVKNAKTRVFRGWAYYGANGASLITIGIGAPERFPFHEPVRAGWPIRIFQTWREALVGVAAHEFHHAWQFMKATRSRSELDCEACASQALKEFREAGVTIQAQDAVENGGN